MSHVDVRAARVVRTAGGLPAGVDVGHIGPIGAVGGINDIDDAVAGDRR